MEDMDFWEGLGLAETDVVLYRRLVRDPGADLATTARELGWDSEVLEAARTRLVAWRLAVETDRGLEVLEPRAALTSLARRRQSTLDRAPSVAAPLVEEFAGARLDTAASPVLRLMRAERVTRLIVEVLESATSSVDAVVAPPVGLDPVAEMVELEALRRGVRIRSLVDDSCLDSPGLPENLARVSALGEHVRVMSGLTVKLLIIDRTTVILPVPPDGSSETRAVLGTFPALGQAVQAFFDLLWRDATTWTPGEAPSPRRRRADAENARVIELLAAGQPEPAIARSMGMSERTLRRRLLDLQYEYGVVSRFQLGMAYRERGGDRSGR